MEPEVCICHAMLCAEKVNKLLEVARAFINDGISPVHMRGLVIVLLEART